MTKASFERTQPYRLPAGGLIDRSSVFAFRFDGEEFFGHPGDTVASALLANGVRLVGRSFKYHRPRGILSAGCEEPNALLELRTSARREPNTRATVAELYDGLVASSQNRWPTLRHDLLSINSVFSRFLSAGFYYKTFMWPASFWEKVYEPLIRRAAGLGRVAEAADPDYYEKAFAFCDVLVIGSGPTGLMAALAAGRSGARVILCEEDFRMGGRCLAERFEINGETSSDWVLRLEQELKAFPEVTLMRRTGVFGVYDGQTYGALERVSDHIDVPEPYQPRQRLWQIVAKKCVLATGSIERPLVFGDNDRPGIMLAGAVRSYVNRFGVAPGRQALVLTNNDDGLRTVGDLQAAGVAVEAVIDTRSGVPGSSVGGVPVLTDARISRVLGRRQISGVEIEVSGKTVLLPCDLLAVSGGWNPTIHLTSHLGGRAVWNESVNAFVPGSIPQGMIVAGAANGQFDLLSCLTAGGEAGRQAATGAGFSPEPIKIPEVSPESAVMAPLWMAGGPRGKAFVDFQNDVTADDIALAEREGYRSIEQVKRYTTLGMSTDQGKSTAASGVALFAEAVGKRISEVGTTTYRPPYTPVSIAAFAGHHGGRHFRPTRYTPTHQWAVSKGAKFIEVGPWLRAQYYPREGERSWQETVSREVNSVRSSVGICDVSTFGKIDIQGVDASAFLDRVYCNLFSTLPVGKARFGLMLREDGFVLDDGTTSRLSDQHYYMTTTTANAAKVMQHLEFCHQVLWPALDVQMVSVTEQWAQFAIAGPRSRDLLAKLVDAPFDISNDKFPYLGAAELTICKGIEARLYRLSFSGELAYELTIPARLGDWAFRALLDAGSEFGVTPYGTEALGTLRVEKGHASGPEINGQTTAIDLNLGQLLSTKKDFVGRFMAARPDLMSNERQILVGLKPVDRNSKLFAGAHFLPRSAAPTVEHDEGFMTSVTFSPTLGHWIGLGLLARGPSRIGEIVRAYDPVRNNDALVEVCSPCFVDPKGERLRV